MPLRDSAREKDCCYCAAPPRAMTERLPSLLKRTDSRVTRRIRNKCTFFLLQDQKRRLVRCVGQLYASYKQHHCALVVELLGNKRARNSTIQYLEYLQTSTYQATFQKVLPRARKLSTTGLNSAAICR